MKIKLTSVMVSDQNKALEFYTKVLGFRKKRDIPLGGKYRWISVVSPDEPNGTELALEPNGNPAAKAFTKSLKKQGIPLTAFEVKNIEQEYKRLKKRGVKFKSAPQAMDKVTFALFDDTCGNWIQMYQVTKNP